MDSKTKAKLYFAGYFVVFPIIFIVSSFVWRAMILNKEFAMVASDALSILGIYYLITSLIYMKNIKSLRS